MEREAHNILIFQVGERGSQYPNFPSLSQKTSRNIYNIYKYIYIYIFSRLIYIELLIYYTILTHSVQIFKSLD